jgi:putative ABC transport system permease protein
VNLLAALRTALRALRKNKLRSLLAMLGIVIAVAAVVATVAIGQGAKEQVARQMASLGSNLLMIVPGAMTQRGASTGAGAQQTLTREDGLAIEREIAGVAAVAPVNRANAQLVYGDANWSSGIIGTTSKYLEVRQWPLARGEPFSREEEAAGAKVCILGQTVADKLFAGRDPQDVQDLIGEQIRVRHLPCKVIGLLEAKGQGAMGQDQDDVVLMPWSTLARKLQGSASDTVGTLMVAARSPRDVDPVQREITSLLQQRHRLAEGGEPDFQVRNLAEMQAAANAQAQTISALLASVALISLIVGSIGIANVMLVSVTERTREIGIRMAVGARGRDVLFQFLTEAVVLALAGGLLGLLLGSAVATRMAQLQGWPAVLSGRVMLQTMLLAGAAGVIAGFYPALRASRLDPIDALRFE